MKHEHDDHPNFKSVVLIKNVSREPTVFVDGAGNKTTPEDNPGLPDLRDNYHALIFVEGTIAVTLFEMCYYVFFVGPDEDPFVPNRTKTRGSRKTGELIMSPTWDKTPKYMPIPEVRRIRKYSGAQWDSRNQQKLGDMRSAVEDCLTLLKSKTVDKRALKKVLSASLRRSSSR